jgi:hypothetical protein
LSKLELELDGIVEELIAEEEEKENLAVCDRLAGGETGRRL